MSTKAQLEVLIATRISGTQNTVAEEVVLWDAIKSELFPSEITETNTSNTITFPQDGNVSYNIKFKKVGSTVFFYGQITNTSNGSIGDLDICQLTGGVYNQKTSSFFSYLATKSNSSFNGFIYINGDYIALKANELLGSGLSIQFNGSYNTND